MARIYPVVARSEWLSIDVVDLNGDGKPEIVGLQPFSIGEFPAMVRLIPGADPLDEEAWTEESLASQENATFALPGDLDGDGDTDFFAGASALGDVLWFRNVSSGSRIALQPQSSLVEGFSGDIHSPTLADLNGDSRLDVAAALDAGIVVVFTQGPTTSQAWSYRTVGDFGLDGVAGLAAADIDGDGDNDLIVGSQGSGPSEKDSEVEPEQINMGAPAGRIAWLQSPGEGTGAWIRHDIFRRERGRFGALLPTDADGDGDIDLIGVRSDSGALDGLFWLQQLHSPDAVVRFLPARRVSSESLALPLP
ncbi:MAG: VCBS repeat-containing protein [Acidobacteria bacterium]|nr:VCBS repeat-containing protein [Acidobacteriota bacterium]